MKWVFLLRHGFLELLKYLCLCAWPLSHVLLFATSWTVAHQAPRSVEFSKHEYWSGLPFPSPILHRNLECQVHKSRRIGSGQEMAKVNVDILGVSELKWTGMGELNSDDHYIYYCGQESLRRNGVAIIVK